MRSQGCSPMNTASMSLGSVGRLMPVNPSKWPTGMAGGLR